MESTDKYLIQAIFDSILNLFIVSIIRTTSIKGANVTTFYNVIAQDGADPWMYKHTDGWYYLTRSTGGDVRIWRSRTFTSIDAGESRVAWTPPGSGPACGSVWAPEIHFINSGW
jgi:GH43 family beta-xylosidase